MIEDKKVSLIVSGGRTGTQFLGERLQQAVADCTSFHEPDTLTLERGELCRNLAKVGRFGVYHMVLGKLLGRTGIKNINRRYLSGRIDVEQAAAEVERCRRQLYSECATSLVVESNYSFFGLIPVLPECISRYRVVVIVRDPRWWIQSYLQKRVMYGARDWLTPFGIGKITPSHVGDRHVWARWHEMSPVAKIAWNWSLTYGLLWDAAQQDDNVAWFRFEDLFGAGARFDERDRLLQTITDFPEAEHEYRMEKLGLDRRINASERNPEFHWTRWPAADARVVEESCGRLMRRFGYGGEEEWQRIVA